MIIQWSNICITIFLTLFVPFHLTAAKIMDFFLFVVMLLFMGALFNIHNGGLLWAVALYMFQGTFLLLSLVY
jgi:hypothetical protein